MLLSASHQAHAESVVVTPPPEGSSTYTLALTPDVVVYLASSELDRLVELLARVRDENTAR